MRSACRVVLTRTPVDNARLRSVIGSIDAELVDYPCIAIETIEVRPELAARLQRGEYATHFFVSRNAVEHLFSQVTPRRPPHVVSLGLGTTEALHANGWTPDTQPTDANMECVLRELDQLVPREGRVLYVRGELGADTLPEALRSRGQECDSVVVYRTRDAVSAPLPVDDLPTLLTFASPSAVRHFVARNPVGGPALAIGETTAQAARAAGFQVTVTPSSDNPALAAAVRHWVAQLQGEATCST